MDISCEIYIAGALSQQDIGWPEATRCKNVRNLKIASSFRKYSQE